MIALIRAEQLKLNNKAMIEYGNKSALNPAWKFEKDSAGNRHKVYVDYIFDTNQDHVVTRQNIKRKMETLFSNPRFETKSDWQNKLVQEFLVVDGLK